MMLPFYNKHPMNKIEGEELNEKWWATPLMLKGRLIKDLVFSRGRLMKDFRDEAGLFYCVTRRISGINVGA